MDAKRAIKRSERGWLAGWLGQSVGARGGKRETLAVFSGNQALKFYKSMSEVLLVVGIIISKVQWATTI